MQKKESKESWIYRWSVIAAFKKFFSVIGFIISAAFSVLMLMLFIAFFSLFFNGFDKIKSGNVEIIPIEGVIATTGDASFLGEKVVQSDKIVKELKKADKNDEIKAIILEINSPGGAPVASYEIANAVKKMKKPTVAVIRETGASGAFWVATAANKIYANPVSVTGSIGVLASHLEFAGLLKRYNVTYRRLVAGKYKDTSSPYKEMTTDEQALYQNILDKLHNEFITAVAQNRKMPYDQVKQLADGFVWLGLDAKEKGLVDELGGTDEAIQYLEKKLNITATPFEYAAAPGIIELFAGVLDTQSFWFGKGFASAVLSQEKTSIVV